MYHLELAGNFKYVLYRAILVAKGEHVHCQLYFHNLHVCVTCVV